MPVHRHRHDKQGSIYAFSGELDAWWAARGAALEDEASPSVDTAEGASAPREQSAPRAVAVERRTAPRIARLGLVAAGLPLAALLGLAVWNRPDVVPAAVSAHVSPHRVLIAEFENHTGEPSLGGRLHDALQEHLGAERFANIVPADQVARFLRLMRKPAGTPIDAGIGREISLRDGSVDAFVTGALDRIETSYVATIRVLTPADAVVVASFRAAAPTPAQLLDAVRQEVSRGRGVLDSALPHDGLRQELARVTTASLPALRLYTESVQLMDHVPIKAGPAFELLMEAARLDPEFASAHVLAAWALRNAKQPQSAVRPHAERAFQLADTTSDTERYFILGSYYQLTFDVEKAISAYEALLRLNPSHYWALGNLGRLYRAVGRNDAASKLRARQVEIRPRQFWGNYRLAEALFLQGDLQGAEDYAVRAVGQVSDVDPGDLQSGRSWLEILPACKAWLRNDVTEAARIAGTLGSTLAQRQGSDRDALTTSLGYMYLALGQRDLAVRMFLRLPQAGERLYHLAVLGSHFGDLRQVSDYFVAPPELLSASALIQGLPALDPRLLPRATDLVDGWAKSLAPADGALVRGQVALMRGRAREARRLLQESIDLREDRFGTPALSASASVARALRLSGDLPQAIHTLEEASQNRFRSCLWPIASAHLWLQIRAELAQLYRQVARETEAEAIEAHLRSLLKVADEEHPILARLNRDVAALPESKPDRN